MLVTAVARYLGAAECGWGAGVLPGVVAAHSLGTSAARGMGGGHAYGTGGGYVRGRG
jgi:hypothetical protein